MVSFTVRMVFLFHSSARALGAIATPSNPMDATARTNCFMTNSFIRFHGCIIDTVATGSRVYSQLACQRLKSLTIQQDADLHLGHSGKVLRGFVQHRVDPPSQRD